MTNGDMRTEKVVQSERDRESNGMNAEMELELEMELGIDHDDTLLYST
jgi:hypothetical protein